MAPDASIHAPMRKIGAIDEEAGAQAVRVGDPADDVEREQARHDEQRGHREAERPHLGRDRERERGVDARARGARRAR